MDAGASVPKQVSALAEQHPEHSRLIEAWWSRWPEMLNGEIQATLELVTRLQGTQIPMFALTNWAAETWPFALQRFEWLSIFDGIVVSGRESVAKPDPKIFRILNDRFGLDPETTGFIDDSAANVSVADQMGYLVHHYTSPGALKSWLAALGLPTAVTG